MVKITSEEELEEWLKDKPADWAQVIAARAALRVMPIALNDEITSNISGFTQAIVRANLISWAAGSFPAHDMTASSHAAAHAVDVSAAVDAAFAAARAVDAAVDSVYAASADAAHAAANAAHAAFAVDVAPFAAVSAASAARAAHARAASASASDVDAASAAIWQSIEDDADYLEQSQSEIPSKDLSAQSLWLANPSPSDIQSQWLDAKHKLEQIDGNYAHWVDWYDWRLRGEEAAFYIPHDKDRIEDKEILKKIADATNEDFWSKGAEYVNALLNEWLREARQRARERYDAENDFADDIEIPTQEESVTAYLQREDGKIDHAPATEENRLRDIPDARQSYADLRKKAQRLLNEGQRLGSALQGALQDFMESLPEDFNQALAYNIWRDGTELREIYDLHKIAAKSSDYEPDKLDEGIATKLNGVLSLFNNLAFDDDGLRQRDERIPPQQEVQNAVQESQIARPILNAGKTKSEIYTEPVLEDLDKLPERQDTPDNVYEQQGLVEENRVKRNIVAALLSGAKFALRHLRKSASDIKTGAGTTTGGLIVTDAAGITEASKSILKFIAEHAQSLKEYVAAAYSNPTLQKLIDTVVDIVNSGIF